MHTSTAAAVKHHREQRGLTQQQLADLMGRNVRTVMRIENGQTLPDFATLAALATGLAVSVDELVHGVAS